MQEDKNYCVYVHKNLTDGDIFYVGSGRLKRASEKSQRGTKWKQATKEHGFSYEVIKSNLSKKDSLIQERILYEEYSKIYPLVNHSVPRLLREFPAELIHQNLEYDESSPTCLRWKTELRTKHSGLQHSPGDIAGNQSRTSRKVRLSGISYLLHKIVLVLHNITWPDGYVVDHINGDYLDNRISNLRVITQAENTRNKALLRKNKCGVTGVFLHKNKNQRDQWRAQCAGLDGKTIQKYFSIVQLGNEEAFRMACEWRAEQIRLLNEQGAGYTERHGK